MNAKERAADAALRHVRTGMTLGLGTGSTARIFIDALGRALARGELADVRGLPTSVASEAQARALSIPVVDFSDVDACDLTIDGADEVTPGLDLIKGLGGALLREKIVAQHSRRLLIVVDASKTVDRLGTRGPLPVEVTRFALPATERFLRSLDCTPTLRHDTDGRPYITDNGNLIYDCRFTQIADPAGLDRTLRARAGVVETGLFVNLAALAIVGTDDGVRVIERGTP